MSNLEAIKLFQPYVCNAAKKNVARVLDSGWIGMGPEVEAFEQEFAKYIGCAHAVATNSATEALRIALHAGQPYDRALVLTTPNTFVATNHVILQDGLIPCFVDIDPNTGSMDLGSLTAHLQAKHDDIAAIMFVHYGGMPCDLSRIRALADRYDIKLIEDAAHCAGAEYAGEKVGKNSYAACFSFHAVKNLAVGDGGMLVTSDALLASKARKLRWFGIDKSTAERTKERQYAWEYNIESLGYKSHMNDITAAIGRGQLTKLDEQNAVREKIYLRYAKNLKGSTVRVLARDPKAKPSNHLMVVRFPDSRHKTRAMERLTKEEIMYGYHYKPNYLYPPYVPFRRDRAYLGMEEFYRTALSLPMHIFLRDHEIDLICSTITSN